jgi:hypothetical protein
MEYLIKKSVEINKIFKINNILAMLESLKHFKCLHPFLLITIISKLINNYKFL